MKYEREKPIDIRNKLELGRVAEEIAKMFGAELESRPYGYYFTVGDKHTVSYALTFHELSTLTVEHIKSEIQQHIDNVIERNGW